MPKKLIAENVEVEMQTLRLAQFATFLPLYRRYEYALRVVAAVTASLSPEDRERFQEYLNENDPCYVTT
jgi:hypothetical protein